MRVILLFVDGVGIGKNDPSINPFFRASLPYVRSLCGGELPHFSFKRFSSKQVELIPVNATLGVQGLPQSGTGQTAIFTGVNAAKKFGKHFGPYPPTMLRPVIQSKNVFQQLKLRGKSVVFANAFPKRFFEYTASGTRRLSVTTLACLLSGIPLLTANELGHDEGISADFTRAKWPELGHPTIRPITPQAAGEHLWHIALRNDFTLFEYWLPDHAGHSQEMAFAVDTLEKLDEFLGGFFRLFDFDRSLFLMVSDHGNIEDLSTKSHTRNQVPCFLVGRRCHEAARAIKNLTHITPTIVRLIEE